MSAEDSTSKCVATTVSASSSSNDAIECAEGENYRHVMVDLEKCSIKQNGLNKVDASINKELNLPSDDDTNIMHAIQ